MFKSIIRWLALLSAIIGLPLFGQDAMLEAEMAAIKAVCLKETMSYINRDQHSMRACKTDAHEFVRLLYDEESAHGSAYHKKLEPNLPNVATKKAEPYPFQLKNDDYIFHIQGDLAWVSYSQTITEPTPGREITWIMRENRTLRKENGEWKILGITTVCTGCDDPQLYHILTKLLDISNQLVELKEKDKALKVFQLVLDLFPESATAYAQITQQFLKLGDNSNAEIYATKSLELMPTDTNTPQWRQAFLKKEIEAGLAKLRGEK
jgi:tetratricopeptide (TPR) repeat protein